MTRWLLGAGEGETVTDRPESHVQVKADLDALLITESR